MGQLSRKVNRMGQNSGWHSSDCPGKGKQRPGLRQENMTEEKLGCLGECLGGRGKNVVIVEEKTWKGPRDFHPECILLTFSQIKGFLQSLCFGHRKVTPRASVQCPGGRLPQKECTGSWLVDLVLGEINLNWRPCHVFLFILPYRFWLWAAY